MVCFLHFSGSLLLFSSLPFSSYARTVPLPLSSPPSHSPLQPSQRLDFCIPMVHNRTPPQTAEPNRMCKCKQYINTIMISADNGNTTRTQYHTPPYCFQCSGDKLSGSKFNKSDAQQIHCCMSTKQLIVAKCSEKHIVRWN